MVGCRNCGTEMVKTGTRKRDNMHWDCYVCPKCDDLEGKGE